MRSVFQTDKQIGPGCKTGAQQRRDTLRANIQKQYRPAHDQDAARKWAGTWADLTMASHVVSGYAHELAPALHLVRLLPTKEGFEVYVAPVDEPVTETTTWMSTSRRLPERSERTRRLLIAAAVKTFEGESYPLSDGWLAFDGTVKEWRALAEKFPLQDGDLR